MAEVPSRRLLEGDDLQIPREELEEVDARPRTATAQQVLGQTSGASVRSVSGASERRKRIASPRLPAAELGVAGPGGARRFVGPPAFIGGPCREGMSFGTSMALGMAKNWSKPPEGICPRSSVTFTLPPYLRGKPLVWKA